MTTVSIRLCLVCGADLDEQAERCETCDTSIHVMLDMLQARHKPRFLFGRIRPEDVNKEPFKNQPPPPIEIPDDVDLETPPPVPRTASPQPAIRSPRRPNPHEIELEDEAAEEFMPPPRFSALWDLLICVVLNALVIQVVIWVSPRDLDQLVQFSLIPVLFVMLIFTALYFWLFLGLFHKSLGRLIAERLGTRG